MRYAEHFPIKVFSWSLLDEDVTIASKLADLQYLTIFPMVTYLALVVDIILYLHVVPYTAFLYAIKQRFSLRKLRNYNRHNDFSPIETAVVKF